eukprot:COSAG01_NODE_939_length_12606_cov_97.306308_4_plen_65_part_00
MTASAAVDRKRMSRLEAGIPLWTRGDEQGVPDMTGVIQLNQVMLNAACTFIQSAQMRLTLSAHA